MPLSPHPSLDTGPEVGQLCVGADWACANGDLGALRYMAQCLATHAEDPVHYELLRLAEDCNSDPERAVERWMRIKRTLTR